MKYLKLTLLMFIVIVSACDRKAAQRHQELADEHDEMEKELVAREDRYATLLQEYHEFAELHREMLEDTTDTSILELEEMQRQTLERHAGILAEQQKLIEAHSELEGLHKEGNRPEGEISLEHERMKQEHQDMLKQHEQMAKDLDQLKKLWHERVMEK